MADFNATARNLKDRSVQSLHMVKDKISDKSKEAAKVVDRQAHRKPWIFVSAAAAFSAFFGFILGRKTTRNKR